MDPKWLLGFTIFVALSISPTYSLCERFSWTSCNYTVTCERSPTAISNPSCDQDPYVTFILKKSILRNVATSFFASTNFDARVRVFKAMDNSWGTLEESAFRYYYKIVSMEITNSQVTTIKDKVFNNLNYLRFLNLSNNQIKTIHPKAFLISDTKTNNIEELDLSNNELINLESELNELTNLKLLHLQNNKLSVVADDAFVNLKNLNSLYLQYNQITGLNLTLTNLRKLTELDASYNMLKQLTGFELNRLVSLVKINLSHNDISFVEPSCFMQAHDLESIDLSFNKINITIDTVMFKYNVKLSYLDLYSNSITGVQKDFLSNSDINYFNMDKNNLSGDLLEHTFTGINNLDTLNLTDQHITGIKNYAFAGMESLVSLNLTNNSISTVEEFSFVNTSIESLDLSHNNIQNLIFLENGLKDLTSLYLRNNEVSVIPKHAFKNQTQIVHLDISMNKIVRIEENSLPLVNLQYLYVQENRLEGVLSKNVFSPAKYLRFLDLSNFNLTRVESMALVDMPVLVRLNLSNNQIEQIEPNNFIGVDNMYSLDVSFNKLTNFKLNNSTLKNLKALYINHNKLSNLTEIFPVTCQLMYLDASYNEIIDLSGLGFSILPNLTSLHLNFNNIKNFNNPNTNSLKSLIVLTISSNQLNNITLAYFPDLLSVDLSNNHITFINNALLQNVKHLQSLDISRNSITDIPPGTFKDVTNLKMLNMSSNLLTGLRYGSLKGLHKTEVFDISRNHITELDVDLFHECEELTKLIIDYNKIKIFDVERLLLLSHKLKTLSLGGNPIACKEILRNVKSVNSTFSGRGQVEVTSIHKIYHEDNVHGIKCGDDFNVPTTIVSTTTAYLEQSSAAKDPSTSSIAPVFIVCSLIFISIVLIGGVLYFKRNRKGVMTFNSVSRTSLELRGTEFQRDLLN